MKRFFICSICLILLVGCSSSPPAKTTQLDSTSTAAPVDEQIRGNRNSKIYHWPGCPNYDDISPSNRVMFKTRAEAEAAGYRAARNC